MEVREALDALIEATGEHRARAILASVARPSVLTEFERIVAERLAARLRAAKEPRPVIRDRLMLLGMSSATAYRVMDRVMSTPPANCLSEGGAVRREPATVALSDHSKTSPIGPNP